MIVARPGQPCYFPNALLKEASLHMIVVYSRVSPCRGPWAVTVIFLLALWTTSASAAIPLTTDDTGTQGKGNLQLELLGEFGRDQERRVTSNNSDLSATLTYGISDTIDIVLSVPYQAWRTDDADFVAKESGIGDLTIEAKWRFHEFNNWSFALKPGMTIPIGNEDKGLGTGRATYSILFITPYNSGEERFAPGGRRIESPEEKAVHHIEWAVHFNAGYTLNENSVGERTDLWSLSVAGSVEFIEDFYVVADLGVRTNTDAESSTPPAYVLAGIIYSPAESVDLGLGLKIGLNRTEADYTVRGGITSRF